MNSVKFENIQNKYDLAKNIDQLPNIDQKITKTAKIDGNESQGADLMIGRQVRDLMRLSKSINKKETINVKMHKIISVVLMALTVSVIVLPFILIFTMGPLFICTAFLAALVVLALCGITAICAESFDIEDAFGSDYIHAAFSAQKKLDSLKKEFSEKEVKLSANIERLSLILQGLDFKNEKTIDMNTDIEEIEQLQKGNKAIKEFAKAKALIKKLREG